MRLTLISIAVVALACGGEKKTQTTQTMGAPPSDSSAAVAPANAPAGPMVAVRMTGDGSRKAAFEPSALTIAPGTTVRFINVSGGPHNIAFWPDSIPAGGSAALKQGMPNPMTDLTSPFIMKPHEEYDVSFTGAPAGVYKGYCQPHLALGMKIKVTVK